MKISKQVFGAIRAEWEHFAERLKMRADLLPVVSNPNAVVAPYSKIVALGKTPSRYNSERLVHGIPRWTEVDADRRDIARWAREGDYGICLQTRRVRAFDIDLADTMAAYAVEKAIRDVVPGVTFPMRYRPNSGKRLLAFTCEDELTKRVLHVGAERIELLATGQQFVALGMHPSGQRYVWTGGLPEGFPVLTIDEVNLIWDTLELLFSTGPAVVTRETRQRVLDEADATSGEDDVAVYLAEQGLIIDEGGTGQLYLECPWIAGHTMDSGPSQTAYFPAHTGGFDNGHFKCLHAGCNGRSDDEFLDALGYNADTEFRARSFPRLAPEVVPSVPALGERSRLFDAERPVPTVLARLAPDAGPIFRRDTKGKIPVTQHYVSLAIGSPEFITRKIRYDNFQQAVVWAWNDEPDGEERWKLWSDVDSARVARTLDCRDFKNTPSVGMIRAALDDIAKANPMDTAIDWLRSLEWDGVKRIDGFMPTYLGSKDSEYTRAVGRYMWTALAGRCLQPGVKADMAIVLVTPIQGKMKTTMIETLVPDPDWFVELDLGLKDDDLGRLMRGKLVCELSELRGLAGKDSESIKSWISRKFDGWTPKYKEHAITAHRRCIFIGTTNEDNFLADATGERRWLPLYIKQAYIKLIAADRDQLWAEAAWVFDREGIAYQEAEHLAPLEHVKFKVADPLEDKLSMWLVTPGLGEYRPADREWLTLEEVFEQGLNKKFADASLGEHKRIGRVLRALGYREARMDHDDIRRRVWTKEKTDEI